MSSKTRLLFYGQASFHGLARQSLIKLCWTRPRIGIFVVIVVCVYMWVSVCLGLIKTSKINIITLFGNGHKNFSYALHIEMQHFIISHVHVRLLVLVLVVHAHELLRGQQACIWSHLSQWSSRRPLKLTMRTGSRSICHATADCVDASSYILSLLSRRGVVFIGHFLNTSDKTKRTIAPKMRICHWCCLQLCFVVAAAFKIKRLHFSELQHACVMWNVKRLTVRHQHASPWTQCHLFTDRVVLWYRLSVCRTLGTRRWWTDGRTDGQTKLFGILVDDECWRRV